MSEGPFARIKLSCEFCSHFKTTGYTVMGFGDKGFYARCDKEKRSIGQDTTETPLWCPFLEKAVKAEINRAEKRLKDCRKIRLTESKKSKSS